MKRCSSFFRTILVYYTVFCVALGGLPFEGFFVQLREGNIVDVVYRAQKNKNIIDVARDFVEPQIPTAYADGATDAMMVYDTVNNATSTPKFRLWDGSAWGSEQSASAFAGSELYNMQVRYAPTRDEAILVAITNTGQIQAQVFNGSTWGSPTTLSTVGDTVGNPNGASLYRGFDIEYEQTSGDAIVVVADNSADPDYYVWNGTSWSGPTNIDIPTTGRPFQIELASRPGSDELAFIALDTNSDVYAMRWTGSAWNNMGVATAWETTASIGGTRKAIDVAFETTSGDIMFAWGFATAATAHFRYRAYASSVLGAVTNVTNANNGGVANWIKLAPNPTSGSNQIMIGILDAGADLNTFLWDGSAWSAVHTEHSAGTENAAAEMDFDIVFETHSSNPNDAWLVFNNTTNISRKLWNGTTWGTSSNTGDDNNSILLNAHPNNGAVIASFYEDDTSGTGNLDILSSALTGGSQTWGAVGTFTTIWAGPVRRNLGITRMAQAVQSYNSSNEAMLVYVTEDSTTYPQYRRWTGSSWSSAASASGTNGELRHMVLKTSPVRDEAALVTLGNNGQVEAQIWDGTTGSWGSAQLLNTLNNTAGSRDTQSLYRGFDIEYENNSGDLIVVTGDGTADPNYHVWNGTSWTGPTNIDIPTTGRPSYIELASKPGSDELAMILIDSNVDVYGMRWTGSAWDNMGTAAVWDATGAIATEKSIDVAYETTSGDIMFLWGDSVSTDRYYRTYSGTTLSAATLLDNAQAGGIDNWITLASNPTAGSNQIMLGILDGGSDLNTFLWDGSAWSAVHAEHTAAAETHASHAFHIAFETHSSNPNDAWLIFGNGTTVSRRLWDGGTSSWGTATTQGDDTNYMSLNAQPNSGAVLMMAYESSTSASMDITENRLTGGSQTWGTATAVYSGPVMRTALPYTKIALASERYISPTYTQQAYRFFNNANSADVGSPLAAQDTAASLGSAGAAFRLRMLLRVDTNTILPNEQDFKLQFAQKSGTCDIGFSGETYADVTDSTLIAYNNNATPADGAALTANANDPTDGGRTIVNQDYEELNNFTNTEATIASGQDGKWDFALVDNGALSNTDYCFRIVKADGSTLNTYTVIPQITTAAGGSVSVDIVDNDDTPVPSPSVSMNSVVVTIGHQSATGVFGVSAEKIRVTNNSGNPQWTLTLAADAGPTAFWDGSTDYDFNDPTANAGDGADADNFGGRMSLNPSVGTLGGTCTAAGITKGSSASFSEGVVDSLTILTAGAGADTQCYWDFTGIDISQTIPGEKPTGSYSISMTLTATAI